MSDKPKKTLSEEQLKKMQEGRKKANEKRKKEREEARKQAKDLNEAKKSKDKEKLLQLELEAMEQQQSRIDNLRLQVERKKQVKSKLKNIKATQEAPEEQIYEQPPQQDDDKAKESIIENILEHVEEEVEHQQDLQAEQHKDYVPTNEEYELVFRTQANKMRNKIPVDTRKYYDEAIKKFDFTLSLDDNIKSMIDYCKDVVKENTVIANSIRNKQIERENKKEIVQKTVAEKVTEQSVDSKIYKLMKLK